MDFKGVYMFDNYEDYVAPTMERLRHKKQLINDLNELLKNLSMYEKLYKRKYKKFLNSVLSDGIKGFRQINKKNPIFIEMPKLKAVPNTNGQVRKQYSDEEISRDDEIEVNLPNLPERRQIDKF